MSNWGKKSVKNSRSILALSRNLFAKVGERWKTFGMSNAQAGIHWTQIHSATAVQGVQINGRVITWSNVVSCLPRI